MLRSAGCGVVLHLLSCSAESLRHGTVAIVGSRPTAKQATPPDARSCSNWNCWQLDAFAALSCREFHITMIFI